MTRAKMVLERDLRQLKGRNLLVIDNAGFSFEEVSEEDLPGSP